MLTGHFSHRSLNGSNRVYGYGRELNSSLFFGWVDSYECMVEKNYLEQLFASIATLCPVSDAFVKALQPLLVSREFKENRNLLREGEVQQQLWFVARGMVREVTLSRDTAEGRTSWFWYEGDFVFARPGFFAGLPGLVEIEAYGGAVLLELRRMDLAALMQDFPEVPLLIETLRYCDEAARAAHMADLINIRHAEMARRFYQQHRAALLTARAKDIASFLGIKDNGIRRFLKGL